MPRIIINEKELTTFAQFNATENSVLVPLFVTVNGKQAARYTQINEFKKDFPISYSISDEKEEVIDGSESYYVYRAIVGEDNVVSYNIYEKEIKNQGEDDRMEIPMFDRSYLMVCELLAYGLPVVVKPIYHDGVFEDDMESWISALTSSLGTAFAEFKDKNLWNIKFITSGAYPNVIYDPATQEKVGGSYSSLRSIASSRGDCIDLMEFEKDLPFTVESTQSESNQKTLKNTLLAMEDGGVNYEAAFYPWGNYTTPAAGLENQTSAQMPASFGYLLAVANNALSNADWLANSGTIRGRVPNLGELLYNIGESAMHFLQGESDDGLNQTATGVRVNPIMPVGVYGTRIWGNRTSKNDTSDSYTNFLNVRILLCDIKKQLYHSALRITFEPNDDLAWINFKKLNNTLLDQMQSGRGIQWYRWNKLATEAKATLKALLTIKPIEALEYFDITVSLAEDGTATVEEI